MTFPEVLFRSATGILVNEVVDDYAHQELLLTFWREPIVCSKQQ